MADLFAAQEEAARAERREEILRHSWSVWGWPGPSAGGLCEIDYTVPDTPDGPGLYCYCEQARLIDLRSDGRWLARIEMPQDDWYKNGREVLLERWMIGPPRRLIREQRLAA